MASGSSKVDDEDRKFSWQNWRKLKQIAPYIKPHAWGYFVGILMISVSSVFTLLVTRLWGQLGGVGVAGLGDGDSHSPDSGDQLSSLQAVGLDTAQMGLEDVGWLILAVLGIQAIISFSRVLLFAHMTEDMMMAIRQDAFSAIVAMPMAFYDSRRVGDLNSRISSDVTAIQDVFTVTLAELLRQFIIIVGGILALLYFSVTLTLLMLVTLPVVIVVAIGFGRYIRKLSKRTQDQVADSNTIVQEMLTGIVSVKSYANERLELSRYIKSIREIRTLALRGALWRGSFSSFIILFIFGAITLVIFKGADLMASGGLASEHFFTFLLMTGLVAGSIGGLAAQFTQLQRGLGAIESLMEIIHEKREVNLGSVSDPAQQIPKLKGEVAFRDVAFHYPSRPDVPVLEGFSLEMERGEQVALVGPSGAGKSTVAALLLRFHQPVSGQILVDNQPLNDMELTAYRRRLAYVPQEVILFGGDIRENIAYGRPDASDAQIREAAHQANALKFIEAFPDGFSTVVGERGVQLSGGQRQRIAIARAILRDPDILILDEATSALDTTSEHEVQMALDALMKGRTSLVIAHRLSTIRRANLIAVISNGKISETGTHEALMAQGGEYKTLIENQTFQSE